MKIKAEILEAKINGDKLELRLQGAPVVDAPWRDMGIYTLHVPGHLAPAYHVGRHLVIDVSPL